MIEANEIFDNTHRIDYPINLIERQDGSRLENPLEFKMNEEVYWATNGPIDYQERYVDRIVTLDAYQKIVNETFDFCTINNGAEFGCGIYGFLYNYLLPKGTKLVQYDINPVKLLRIP